VEQPLGMRVCTNHPGLVVHQSCADCLYPYCDACLVEVLGTRLCGPCRDRRIQMMQGPDPSARGRFAGTGTVDIPGWLSGGWATIQSDLGVFLAALLVATLLTLATCGIAWPALQAGLLIMCFRKALYGHVAFDSLFDGFRRFGNAFLLVLIMFGVQLLLLLILYVPLAVVQAMVGEESTAARIVDGAGNFLNFVLGQILDGATFFALPHIAARNVGPITAIRESFAIFARNPVVFSLLSLIWGIVSVIGVLACIVGVLVTSMITVAATAKAYIDHFGLEDWDPAS
jgi:hypothetical protein